MLLDLLRQAELCRAQCAEILEGPICLKVSYQIFVSIYGSFKSSLDFKCMPLLLQNLFQ